MLFDGNSEVTEAIQAINTDKGFENLSKIASYTEKNKKEKESVQKKYEELQIASTKKDQEIRNLKTIKKLLLQVKQSVEKFNQYFSNGRLWNIAENSFTLPKCRSAGATWMPTVTSITPSISATWSRLAASGWRNSATRSRRKGMRRSSSTPPVPSWFR